MSEKRPINDADIDRAVASLVDGDPSRGFRASVMRRIAGGEPAPGAARPWRLALAGAATMAVLAVAVGLWSLRDGAPQPPGAPARPAAAAVAAPEPPASPAGQPPVAAVRPATGPRAISARRMLPVAGLHGERTPAEEAADSANAAVMAAILLAPLPGPEPLVVPPLGPAAAGRAWPDISLLPELPDVVPLAFELLKLERVNVPPLTLPPPAEADSKGKIR